MLAMKMKSVEVDYGEMLDISKADLIVGLDRWGNEIAALASKNGISRKKAVKIFPVVIDQYEWSRKEQIKHAQEFRDRIEYIYSPENDSSHPMLSTWRLDDTARLKATLALPFGKKVLETGCSSGTVTIEIAKLPQTIEVVGIDLRPDAIQTAKNLVAKLTKEGKLDSKDAGKIKFQVSSVEDLYCKSQFDNVCAFEILEHLVSSDFHKALKNMGNLLKDDGTFFMSVPNRYPDEFYVKTNRIRWQAPDHKNYFSKESLTYLLKDYFEKVIFYSLDNQPVDKGVYLLVEARGKIKK
jgi:2-polyprenyl-3-methyl-5-hydroxy-6-metoxy-1,4-benzoquinol methylase